MKWYNWRVIVGVVLVLVGALALLQSFNIIPTQFEGQGWAFVFGAIFLVVGAVFIPLTFQDREKNWWAVIPGFTLVGLGLLVILGAVLQGDTDWLAGLFLGSIGLAFLVIFLLDRAKWWAIIPAGTLLSLTILVSVADEGIWPVVVLFGGLAVTFAVVALSAGADPKARAWAWWPAGILALMAVIFAMTSEPVPGIVWPVLLILAGGAMVAWTFLRPKA